MFYLIYKIINNVNGMIYIGSHATKDIHDGYLGSGKLIRAAVKKYGETNFTKEILYIYSDKKTMYLKELELVNEEFVASPLTYNLMLGGRGGWDHRKKKVNAKDSNGKIYTVFSSDPRLATGELVGNTRGLKYFNDGEKTYRLDPRKTDTTELLEGRMWSADDRKWFNDGVRSFFIKEERSLGLNPGRLNLNNTHLKGRKYFNDGVKSYRLFENDPKATRLASGRILKSQKPSSQKVSQTPGPH